MFSLIITIISIALVAALALATIYYGGTAFNKGSAEAKASQLINEGQQINGAKTMQNADVAAGDTSKSFTPDYLAQAPAVWTIPVGAHGSATVVTSGADVCQAVNAKAGLKAADTAAAADTDSALVVVAGDLTGKKVYGCTTADLTVSYTF